MSHLKSLVSLPQQEAAGNHYFSSAKLSLRHESIKQSITDDLHASDGVGDEAVKKPMFN